jgi:hypothetical protein
MAPPGIHQAAKTQQQEMIITKKSRKANVTSLIRTDLRSDTGSILKAWGSIYYRHSAGIKAINDVIFRIAL